MFKRIGRFKHNVYLNKALQTQFLREMTQLNVIKINEARKLLQLNPIEEGDKLYGEMGQGTQVIEPQDNSGGENE